VKILIAIPVYNEEKYVCSVLKEVLKHAPDPPRVLVIDDGSTDRTSSLLEKFPVDVIRHCRNRGYGRSLQDAFYWAGEESFDWLITMDCDEQHEPAAIPRFVAEIEKDDADVISGSRYMVSETDADSPPPDRRAINGQITLEINRILGLRLTDSFCGFKAYRVSAVQQLDLSEPGYAFPMQFWVQAVAKGLRIREIPVRLIYNDLNRTFGGPLNDAKIRLQHYREVLAREIAHVRTPGDAPNGHAGIAGCSTVTRTDGSTRCIEG
jgi:glycosyltransferase involved in cell wall biosynthesis